MLTASDAKEDSNIDPIAESSPAPVSTSRQRSKEPPPKPPRLHKPSCSSSGIDSGRFRGSNSASDRRHDGRRFWRSDSDSDLNSKQRRRLQHQGPSSFSPDGRRGLDAADDASTEAGGSPWKSCVSHLYFGTSIFHISNPKLYFLQIVTIFPRILSPGSDESLSMSFDDPKPTEAKNPHALWNRSETHKNTQQKNACAISAGDLASESTKAFAECLNGQRVQESASLNSVSLSWLFPEQQQG